jgi:hypothetical protein
MRKKTDNAYNGAHNAIATIQASANLTLAIKYRRDVDIDNFELEESRLWQDF